MGMRLPRAGGLLLALLAAGGVRAAELETLVMPGPVIQGHADIEAECTRCHSPFDRAAEDRLCLDCHDEVAADREHRSGFHGRAPLAASACRSCHPEHKGRGADALGLNPARFDHSLTDYPLEGAHRAVPCESCHAKDAPHREASSRCVDCHRADDPHREQLGSECGDCHAETAWKQARFDHAKTDFPLEGAHREVACGLCHANERWEGAPRDCAACHRLDDVHQGRFGPRCEECHDVKGFETVGFDHDRDTEFRLTGEHRGLACSACHTGVLYEEDLGSDCVSCHRPDDVHRGRFGPRCGDCHGTADWARLSFDHDRDTDFALHGSHREVPCQACHTGVLHEEDLGRDCIACHREDDVHRGAQGEACGACHDEGSWVKKVAFDHDLTRFPLLGLHAAVACEECHPSQTYKDVETACIACHRTDDPHEARLGESCGLCHNPNGWKLWRFDHDAQSTFALHGAHQGVDCRSCHAAPVEGPSDAITLARECVECHATEDAHGGRFGRRCEDCHAESAWSDVRLPR